MTETTTLQTADPRLAEIQQQVLLPELGMHYGRVKATKDLRYGQEKIHFLSIVGGPGKSADDLRRATPQSLYNAFVQAGSMGLSFNPLLGHCYLIPRRARRKEERESWEEYKRTVPIIAYASPGYRGLIHLAVIGGAVKWARAEIVRARDHYRYLGPTTKPVFEAGGRHVHNSAVVPRGEWVAVFAHAQTIDGCDLAGEMTDDMIAKVRARSEAPNSMMWTDFPEEGWKKALLRREYKTWPGVASAPLLQRALGVLGEHEGLDFSDRAANAIEGEAVKLLDEEHVTQLHAMLTEAGATPEAADKTLAKLAKLYGCVEIKDVPADKFDDAKRRVAEKIEQAKAAKK